jgi:hypothetical protein
MGLTIPTDGQTSDAAHLNQYIDWLAGYQAIILSDAPVAYWRLGETSGTTAYDISGNGLNGTYQGGVTLGQPGALVGDGDTAAGFNGSTGLVSIPQISSLAGASFSVETWFYLSTTPPSNGLVLVDIRVSETVNGHIVLVVDTATRLVGGFYANSTAGGNIGLNAWYHGVLTYDASPQTIQLYLNGSQVASRSGVGPLLSGTQTNKIGNHTLLAQSPWPGRIDEVAIYNYALSASQVAAHYRTGIAARITDTPIYLASSGPGPALSVIQEGGGPVFQCMKPDNTTLFIVQGNGTLSFPGQMTLNGSWSTAKQGASQQPQRNCVVSPATSGSADFTISGNAGDTSVHHAQIPNLPSTAVAVLLATSGNVSGATVALLADTGSGAGPTAWKSGMSSLSNMVFLLTVQPGGWYYYQALSAGQNWSLGFWILGWIESLT